MRTIPVTYKKRRMSGLHYTKSQSQARDYVKVSPHPAHIALARANAKVADACAEYGDSLGSIVSMDMYHKAIAAVRNHSIALQHGFYPLTSG